MTQKSGDNPEQTPPRRRAGLVSFGADVRRLIAPVLGKKGFIQADILARWADILGAELATGLQPASLSFSKSADGALLRVNAYSGAYAMEFNARKQQIIEKLNTYFGYRAISDIRVTQGGFTPKLPKSPATAPLPLEKQKQIAAETAGIENEALRAAATELGFLIESAKK